jgi:hypothetical protein
MLQIHMKFHSKKETIFGKSSWNLILKWRCTYNITSMHKSYFKKEITFIMLQRHMESRFKKKQYPYNVVENACSLTWKGCNLTMLQRFIKFTSKKTNTYNVVHINKTYH